MRKLDSKQKIENLALFSGLELVCISCLTKHQDNGEACLNHANPRVFLTPTSPVGVLSDAGDL